MAAMPCLLRPISSTIPQQSEADIFPCIDACFMQKKKKSARDPVKKHPDSLFIPEQQTARTEEYVDGVRDEDGYEHKDLLLPRSVLDGCEASFKAADEKREKSKHRLL
ncbi:hypothetical protein B0H14DRAFT_3491975 [Mycena olivaceomarginata]|nr:hypothetical protein B0H14DRAFT_3491975 [Mycena olivaceomarginata]